MLVYPSEKNSQIGNLSQVGVKIKTIWNHHLVWVYLEKGARSLSHRPFFLSEQFPRWRRWEKPFWKAGIPGPWFDVHPARLPLSYFGIIPWIRDYFWEDWVPFWIYVQMGYFGRCMENWQNLLQNHISTTHLNKTIYLNPKPIFSLLPSFTPWP